MERFHYKNEISGDEIRVLVLQPSSSDDAIIECQLEVHSREDHPHYEALSYCWGPPDPATEIHLDGALFKIGDSLSSALHQLRLRDEKRHLWVDAVCIDQNSDSEKSAQVGRMGDTYSKCQRTIAWLGRASDEERSILAVDAIRTIGSQYGDMSVVQVARSQRPLPFMISGSNIDTYLLAIRQLLERPWFTRLWIVQEVCLAPQVQLVCGNETFTMSQFTNMQFSLLNAPDMQPLTAMSGLQPDETRAQRCTLVQSFDMQLSMTRQLFQVTPAEVLKLEQLKLRNCALLTHMLHFRRRRCTVTKDRVYALLSLSLDVQGDIKPDYAEPLGDTFAKVSKAIIIKHKNLDVLALCRGPEPLSSEPSSPEQLLAEECSLPSWAPDFDAKVDHTVSGGVVSLLTNYLPGGTPWFTATPKSCFEPDPTDRSWELTVAGYDLCVVEETTQLKHGGFERAWELMQRRGGHVEDSTASTKEAFWRTMITNRRADSSKAEQDIEGREFHLCWDLLSQGTVDIDSILPSFVNYNRAYWQHGAHRTFFTTSTGLVGLARSSIGVGDHICLLAGGQTPFILREHGNRFQVVSEAYVHGIMYGERWKEVQDAGAQRCKFVLV